MRFPNPRSIHEIVVLRSSESEARYVKHERRGDGGVLWLSPGICDTRYELHARAAAKMRMST